MSAPYDSLVEYISSSGTQYIDTGYAFADGFAFEVDFRYATSNATVFGARASSVRTAVVYYSVTNGLVVNMAGYSGSSTPFKFAGATVTDRHVLKMEVSGGVGTTWLDGVKVHDAVSFSGAYISGVTQAIFATKYGDNDFRDISATTIYGVRMWQGGTLVRDYVPARVGTGGELYDRVSGTLAARVGTLTAGPDKAEPVPSPVGIGGTMLIAAREGFAAAARRRGWTNPYVTDGLVAMWDGEWNAGPGVHDPNATTWVDLSGNGHDFTWAANTAGVAWGANYLQLTNGAKSNIVVAQFASAMVAQSVSGVLSVDWVYSDAYNNAQSPILPPSGTYLIARQANSQSATRTAFSGVKTVGGYNYYLSYTSVADVPTADDYRVTQITVSGLATSDISVYNNGVAHEMHIDTSTTNAGRTAMVLRRPTRTNFRIYNYLMYNRDLTAAEIAANYAIDKARFNLP